MKCISIFYCLIDLFKELQETKGMETTYVCNVHNGDRFEEGAWYLEITGNTYSHRATLKNDGFKWNPDTKVWWKYIITETVPKNVRETYKQKHIKKIQDSGFTYPRYRPKCETKGCNEEKKKGFYKCSTCIYQEACKGGLPCTGWMSNKCRYGNQLTLQGMTFCSHCEKDVKEWCKLDVFKNDYS